MIVVVGLSHRTAPIAVRERLAIPGDAIGQLLNDARQEQDLGEALLLSTCNRVELVAAPRGPRSGEVLDAVAEQAVSVLTRGAPTVKRHLYRHTGADGVRHLFRVAASLDSLVVGEPQILGQLKDAYELARNNNSLGPILNRLVPRALRTAKRIRSQTSIGTGQVSVPSVAIDLAKQIFGSLAKKTVVLVGSGEMAESVAKLLRQAGAKIVVVGRTAGRVQQLAGEFDAEARLWHELGASLAVADVVISSTSAPGFVIDRNLAQASRRARRGKPTFFIDLAVPRDVEPGVGNIDGVFLYNIDDFSKVVAESLSSRQREAERAEQIVQREADGWERWAEAAQVTPTIVSLRERFGGVLQSELDRTLKTRLKHLGPEERACLSKMVEAALNKLMHEPTVRLRQAVSEGGRPDQLVLALEELFLENAPVSEPPRSDPTASSPEAGPEPALETAER